MGERKRETVKERERERGGGVREREKDEESMRIGKERKSPGKTDVPKFYTYNECELSVVYPHEQWDIFLKALITLLGLLCGRLT